MQKRTKCFFFQQRRHRSLQPSLDSGHSWNFHKMLWAFLKYSSLARVTSLKIAVLRGISSSKIPVSHNAFIPFTLSTLFSILPDVSLFCFSVVVWGSGASGMYLRNTELKRLIIFSFEESLCENVNNQMVIGWIIL